LWSCSRPAPGQRGVGGWERWTCTERWVGGSEELGGGLIWCSPPPPSILLLRRLPVYACVRGAYQTQSWLDVQRCAQCPLSPSASSTLQLTRGTSRARRW
jgi:hypothetical protein